jgi:hypothetical protein
MLEKLWHVLNPVRKTSKGKGKKMAKKTSHNLIKRAFWIANLGIQRIPKSAFLKLMNGASIPEVEATLEFLSSGTKRLFIESNGDICVATEMLGCSKCRHVIMSDQWHMQHNKCALSNFVLDKDISKAGRCERFNPVYLELG